MEPTHLEIINQIRSSAAALQRTVEAVPADGLGQRPAESEWSVHEILTHVRNVAMLVYCLRIRRLLSEANPIFANYEEDLSRLAPQPIGEVMQMIVDEHSQLARLLSTLPNDGWQRYGQHPELGIMSLEFLAQRVVDHALEHERQIAETARALS